ncbi:hypothetical protein [Candidatus Contubernalis alkaliaceticus]|uniref:hypothetical protein n=1 Tax=Candidatus Contubernalis alkaliaceticus TaxID=338645 RepID=UPI001F4BD449|nr:hypothetical protein [Candidatus Contubernalis alkalaceticus]UNC91289.1 hypothetical protein HUE98_03815 [Candidatus Contubernalis alkalaceticus]
MSKNISYNLPGYGSLNANLFTYTKILYRFLSYYGHDIRLNSTNQLGVLRNVLPGAHHTRYEYVFIQWVLVTELSRLKGAGNGNLNLSAKRKEFGRLPGIDKYPSGAEVLQSIILLANIGHLPETFTASRAFLHYLHSNKEIRNIFKSGLAREDRPYFEKVLDGFQIYSVQYIVALFLLQRYKRYGKRQDYVSYPINVIRAYINRDNGTKEALNKIWTLYGNVRRVS